MRRLTPVPRLEPSAEEKAGLERRSLVRRFTERKTVTALDGRGPRPVALTVRAAVHLQITHAQQVQWAAAFSHYRAIVETRLLMMKQYRSEAAALEVELE